MTFVTSFLKCRFRILSTLALGAISTGQAADLPPQREWTVDGVVRSALVYVPTAVRTHVTPVVFAFHGHGGNMRQAARSFAIHTHWPEAIVVYMQGLNTPGGNDPDGKLPGWQNAPGVLGDRDLTFFDAVLADLRHDYRVDDRRIYSTGHSNGGGFTYLLWRTRGNTFAAVAPSGSAISAAEENLRPKPVMHVAGRKDERVKFAAQEQTMEALRTLNQCGEGLAWDKDCTLYPSAIGAPVVTMIYDGPHAYPASASALIVRFLKEQTKHRGGNTQ
ncbi:MAG: hypothetical protein Q7S40_31830 [Opitutaceae bacterium]|nr:hypothetical protein [Opitutaceae bacterium]